MQQPIRGRYTTALSTPAWTAIRVGSLALWLSACGDDSAAKPAESLSARAATPVADGGNSAGNAAAEGGMDVAVGGGGAGGAGGAGGSEPPAAPEADGGKPTPPDTSNPGEVDVAALSRELAGALCDALERCVGAQKLAALNGREDCRERLAANFAQSDFATLNESVASGAVVIDEGALERCYRDARELGCKAQTERLPASCQQALAGQRAAGESCTSGADCRPDLFCPITAECPRSCEATHPTGEACTLDGQCQTGTTCVGQRCVAPVAENAACAGSSGAVCALGLSCVGSTDTQAGKCQANSQVQVGALGEACMPGGTLCKEGLSCAYDSPAAFKCRAAATSGATCRLALPGQCPLAAYCDAADVTQDGTCVALPIDGEPCVLGDDCAPGHACSMESTAALCRRIADLGEACQDDSLCRSGLCLAGSCAVPPSCE